MGDVNSTQRSPSSPPEVKRRAKKEKVEDPSDIVIYESGTSSTSEDESGGERGRRKHVHKKKSKWESSGTWISDEVSFEARGEDLVKLAVEEKNLDLDSTQATLNGILYGRDYSKEDELAKRKQINFIVPNNSNYIVHKVTGKETLQGLALMYGVSAADVKKINRLWTNEDMFGRKELVIPITPEEFLKYQEAKGEADSTDKRALVAKLVEIAHCKPQIAFSFLQRSNWDYEKAVGLFFSKDSEEGEEEKIPSTRQPQGHQADDIWEEEPVAKSRFKPDIPFDELRNNLPATFLQSGETSVLKVQKRLQDRFTKQEEEIFDL